MRQQDRTALITGASSGIGFELSKLFAADGYNLVLVARRGRKLNEMAADFCKTHQSNVTVLAKDLSDPAAPAEIWRALQAQAIEIDALVNNAGFGMRGLFAENDAVEESQMVQLNVGALTQLTKLFLPDMLKRKSGRILNIGSTGSFAPVPLMAVYGATKAYVLSFSEALNEELKGTGVTVTALCPGVTATGFQARAKVENVRLAQGAGMTAQAVAAIGYRAMQRGVAVVVPAIGNQALTLAIRLVPRTLVARMSKRMMESPAS